MAIFPTVYLGSIAEARGPVASSSPCSCAACGRAAEMHRIQHGWACSCDEVSHWKVATRAGGARWDLYHVRAASLEF